jgi:hypothetical protein
MEDIRHTQGLEYYTLQGLEYVGSYYINANNNIAYVYDPVSRNNKILVPRHTFNTETVRLRNSVKGGSAAPIPIKRQLKDYDYTVGVIVRYFVQKNNSPQNTIVEIDESQFNTINSNSSKTNIDPNLYSYVSISWRISGNIEYVRNFNIRQIKDSESIFIGLDKFLKNILEFYR